MAFSLTIFIVLTTEFPVHYTYSIVKWNFSLDASSNQNRERFGSLGDGARGLG